MNTLAGALPVGQENERGFFLQAMGRMAGKATWPMEKTGEPTILGQVTSKRAMSKSMFLLFLFPWNYIILGVGQTRCFFK